MRHTDRPLARALAWIALASLAALSPHAPARAASVLKMNLDELAARAGRVYRGTVIQAIPGQVPLGGGEVPVVTYVLRVDEAFKGDFEVVKDRQVATLTTLGKLPEKRVGSLRKINRLPEMPELVVGESYLLLTTTPSAEGLSTTVGLAQGCFQLAGPSSAPVALNAVGNVGLFSGLPDEKLLPAGGPLPYSVLAERLRVSLRAAPAPGP